MNKWVPTIAILIYISFFFGCITSSKTEKLSIDNSTLYPIGENGKWGYVNKDGEKIIEPIYDEVEFFSNGLALIKTKGKYGYLGKDGQWHLKPKYDSGTSFISNCAFVSIKGNSFAINKRGKKMDLKDCSSMEAGGCKIINPADPHKYFKSINGKYELEYKYYIKIDSTNYITINDTSNLMIDEVIEFGNKHILVKKDNSYGLFDIWSHRRIIVTETNNLNHKKIARQELLKLIEFKYDDVTFERFFNNEVRFAKVKIKNKYGVITSKGREVLPVEFDSLEIKPSSEMALVEFEANKFGYKKFDGKEFFKRK